MRFLTGETISGQYRIGEFLAEGGMSFVYRGRDLKSGEPVAIKILKEHVSSNRIEDMVRFRREATAVSDLHHESLVKVYEIGQSEGLNYVVMELFDGKGLDHLLKEGRQFTIEEALDIVKQVTVLLEYVHSRGIVHRDLKPGNILLQENSDGGLNVKIVDFGLAQMMEFTQLKDTRDIVCTFSYMSPEQTGIIKNVVDGRSDLYSLGIVFYQLATNELPFKGDDIGSILHQQIAKQPIPPTRIANTLPKIIEEIILKLLKKEPEERYQTARGLLEDISRYEIGDKDFVLGMNDRMQNLTYRTGLIGRDDELVALKKVYDRAAEGKGGVCLVSGEAGMGKTRLVNELRAYVYEKSGEFFSGKCFDQENKMPYQVFVEVLTEYLDSLQKLSQAEKETEIYRIKNNVGGLGEIICQLNPQVREIFTDTPPLVGLEPEKEDKRFLMVCSKFFRNLSKPGQPLVLMLDDLQWADEGTLHLLSEILRDIHENNILVIGTYRDNEVGQEHSLAKIIEKAKVEQLPLECICLRAFDLLTVNKLLASLLIEKKDEIIELSKYVYDRSKGNSFFTIEVLRQLVSEKIVFYAAGRWKTNWEKLSTFSMSNTILDVLLKRIDMLRQEQVETLSIAAVIGRKFKISMLYMLTKRPVEALINLVDEAMEMQLLDRGSEKDQILFVHDRIKNAFYHKLGVEKRSELHLQIANVLESTYKGKEHLVLFELAHHYSEAGDKDKSLEFAIPAAIEAKKGYANEEAIRYYRIAINILESRGRKDSLLWMEAKKGLIAVYLTIGSYDEVVKIIEEILSVKHGNLERARLYRQLGAAHFKKGEWGKTEDALAEGLLCLGDKLPRSKPLVYINIIKELCVHIIQSMLPTLFMITRSVIRTPENTEKVELYIALSWLYILSDTNKLVYSVLKGLNFSEQKMGKSKELGVCLAAYGTVCMAIPLFRRAFKYHTKAMLLRKELKDEFGVAQSLQWLGFSYSWKGDREKSKECFKEAGERFESIGDLWELGMVVNGLGMEYYMEGRYSEAFDYYDRYIRISKDIKDEFGVSTVGENMIRAYMEMGEFEKAAKWIDDSMELAERTDNYFVQSTIIADCGYIAIKQERWDVAIEHLEKAIALHEQYSFLKDYIVYVYPFLAEAYFGKLLHEQADGFKHRQSVQKIKKLCESAVSHTRSWANHHGASLIISGKFCAYVKKKKKAEAYFRKAINHCSAIGRRYELGKAYYEYGIFLNNNSRIDEARARLKKAYEIFKEIGAGEYVKKMEGLSFLEANTLKGPQARLQDKLESSSIVTVSHHLSSILELDWLLEKIMDVCMEVSGAERGYLFLSSDDKQQQLLLKVKRFIQDDIKEEELSISNEIVRDVVRSGKEVILVDATEDYGFKEHDSVVEYDLRSILCMPLKTKGTIIGVVYLDNRLVKGLFNQEKAELLRTLLAQAAISIENARTTEALKQMQSKLQRYAKTLEEKVKERTMELEDKNVLMLERNEQLQKEISERKQAEEKLTQAYQELKDAQDKLVQSEKMAGIGQLAAGMAHEINNPTSFIVSNTETLGEYVQKLFNAIKELETLAVSVAGDKNKNTEEVKKSLEKIKKKANLSYLREDVFDMIEEILKGARRVKNIVANLRSFAHPSFEKPRMADLNEEIERVLSLIWNELKYKIDLKKELSPLPKILCNAGQMDQVFINILMNAVQSVEERGVISVKTWLADNDIFIEIADTGAGIPKESIEKIFDPFFTTKNVGEGTGLGLSIAYGVIKKHMGAISVKSEQGKGTAFLIKLPVNPANISSEGLELS